MYSTCTAVRTEITFSIDFRAQWRADFAARSGASARAALCASVLRCAALRLVAVRDSGVGILGVAEDLRRESTRVCAGDVWRVGKGRGRLTRGSDIKQFVDSSRV